MNNIINADCLEIMRSMPNKSIDLIITDPPYGIKEHGGKDRHGPQSTKKGFRRKDSYVKMNWDNSRLHIDYFFEMFRVSKNQIIFGMNYYSDYLPPTKGFIVWHKKGTDKSSFAACELIYTSFDTASAYIKFDWIGFGYINNSRKYNDKKSHPTQKPIELIRNIVQRYSTINDVILDPFAGSGTTLLACRDLGRKFIGIEIIKEYCDLANNRLNKNQINIDLTHD